MISINDRQSLQDKIKERPRFYTGIAVCTAILLAIGVYGFYNAKIVGLEIDVSTGHTSNEQVALQLEQTQSHPVTPYQASYIALHGCGWIESGPEAKIEDCQIKPLGVITG